MTVKQALEDLMNMYPMQEDRTKEDILKGSWNIKTCWRQTLPDKETPKFKKVKRLLIENAKDAILVSSKTKIWYHVYTHTKTFGFSVVDGIICDHPNRELEGLAFDINKTKLNLVKVAEYEI